VYSDADGVDDQYEFRRARLYISGLIYDSVEFKAQYDFAGGDADFKDVYIGLVDLPYVGGFRVGHFKEPFSLEELTSSKYITFMERSLAASMAPSRNFGFMLHNNWFDSRLTGALGLFKGETDNYGEYVGDANYAITGRVTGLPWYENEGEKLAHLGVAYSHRDNDDNYSLSFRPGFHLDYKPVRAALADTERIDMAGLEGAVVFGPASLQSEWVYASLDPRIGGSEDVDSYYIQGSYFLTGEHRPYKQSSGAFSRVHPHSNFLSEERGWGAWELALRYGNVDVSEIPGNTGGELTNYTAALNWYLNPNTRVMMNYVHSDVDTADEDDFFGMRFQVDF
jgi:phosphate-selective porin OprO/OprP